MSFVRRDFAVASAAFEREWLVTNSLGGFACGTVAQANTRRYHGLLVAALQPPVQRVVMVAKLEALARYRGSIYAKVPKLPSQINVKLDLPGLNKMGATFLYLWEPGVRH